MARYKKRPSYDESVPGLFDALEDNILLPGVEPLPMHSSIEKAARRAAAGRREEKLEEEEMFGSDDFSPLELSGKADWLNFISFGSGSSGNCSYIGDDNEGMLIDAGVAPDVVEKELARHGIGVDRIRAVLVTHDHSDHVRYIYPLVRKRFQIGVYCTPRTLNGILRRHSISNRIKDYHHAIYKEHPFRVGNFTVTAFEVSHDGTDNSGFIIRYGGRNMVVATDMGVITERADFYMRQADYLMIEANYDEQMLTNGTYPEYLKARIRSALGHLGNTDTAEYLRKIYTPKLRNVFLCHLSKDNNKPELALAEVEKALTEAGATVGDGSNSPFARLASVQLMALPRFDATPMIPLLLR